jgi:hypothetical protein
MDWFYRRFQQTFSVQITNATFSSLFLYAKERMANGDFPTDSGSDSRTLFQVLQQIGICLESADPYSDTAIGQTPTPQMVAQALACATGWIGLGGQIEASGNMLIVGDQYSNSTAINAVQFIPNSGTEPGGQEPQRPSTRL